MKNDFENWFIAEVDAEPETLRFLHFSVLFDLSICVIIALMALQCMPTSSISDDSGNAGESNTSKFNTVAQAF